MKIADVRFDASAPIIYYCSRFIRLEIESPAPFWGLAALIDAGQEPGTKSITLDASRLASGIYFYRLNAGKETAVRRTVLMRSRPAGII